MRCHLQRRTPGVGSLLLRSSCKGGHLIAFVNLFAKYQNLGMERFAHTRHLWLPL